MSISQATSEISTMGTGSFRRHSERVASATRSPHRAAARRASICDQSLGPLRSVTCAMGRGARLLPKRAAAACPAKRHFGTRRVSVTRQPSPTHAEIAPVPRASSGTGSHGVRSPGVLISGHGPNHPFARRKTTAELPLTLRSAVSPPRRWGTRSTSIKTPCLTLMTVVLTCRVMLYRVTLARVQTGA